jgi:hypothetical protein
VTAAGNRASTIAILALAAALRLPLVFSGLPYISYVDEGGVLHPAARLVRDGGWDPGWYQYPSLSIYLTAAVLHASRPVYRLVHGRPLATDFPPEGDLYDLIAPPSVILAGRGVVVAASLVTVFLGMALARRLAGPLAALAAGLLLATTPALVQRACIVITDTLSAAFVAAVLLAAEGLRSILQNEGPSSMTARRQALFAGALAGLAAATKYPAGAVFVVILVAVFGPGGLSFERVRLAALSALAAILATLTAMPALVFSTRQVMAGLMAQAHDYATFPSTRNFFRQALDAEELGWLLAFVSLLGLARLARHRETRSTVASWLAFGGLLLAPLLRYGFQPFRNALPLVPPLLVAAAALLFPAGRGPSAARTAIGGLGLLVVLATFIPGWQWTYRARRVRDSRTAFIDWLASKARPGKRVLFVRELAFLPSELDRVPASIVVAPWAETRALVEGGTFDALVYGKFDLAAVPGDQEIRTAEVAPFEDWLGTLKVELRAGSVPTPFFGGFWRSNDELILIAIRRNSGEFLRLRPGPAAEN